MELYLFEKKIAHAERLLASENEAYIHAACCTLEAIQEALVEFKEFVRRQGPEFVKKNAIVMAKASRSERRISKAFEVMHKRNS